MKLGPYELNSIVTGDARELSKAIPDESVDLIFTDPEYDKIEDYEWLAQTAARVLKPDRACLVWQGTAHLPESLNALNLWLDYQWIFSMSHSNAMKKNIIFALDIFTHWTPLMWYSKGVMKPYKKVRDWLDVPLLSGASENHKWYKSVKGLLYWLQSFSLSDDIIFDPFTGGGTVPAVCKMLNRQYLAFEIDPATADLARERVANTQPPLPIEYPEQLTLEPLAEVGL